MKLKKSLPLEIIAGKIAALGVPGLIFTVVVSAVSCSGGAAIMAALAAIGPGGAIAGIATLGLIGLISDAIVVYGSEALIEAIIIKLYLKGESSESLKDKVAKAPLSRNCKCRLFNTIDEVKVRESF